MAMRMAKLARSSRVAASARSTVSSSVRHHCHPRPPLMSVTSYIPVVNIAGARALSSLAHSKINRNTGVSHGVWKDLQRRLSYSSTPYSNSGRSSQINQSEFTEMAWEGLLGAVEAARLSRQQVVESEHLMKALLEQKDGLARRILTKAGLDNTSVLQATDDFTHQQPKILKENMRH